MYGNTNMYKRALLRLEGEVEGSQKYGDEMYDEKQELLKRLVVAEQEIDVTLTKYNELFNDYEHILGQYHQVIKSNAEVGALNADLQMELEAYRTIENKTGKSPEEIIGLVSNLSGVVDAIRSKSPKCKCSSGE